jgi:tRNA pseudouridine55 synthase
LDNHNPTEGILLVDKPRGKTSFAIIAALRKILSVQKIGHCGTLDPFATGLLVVLIGRNYTKLSDTFLGHDKTYLAELYLGKETNTYDCDGEVVSSSALVPTLDELKSCLTRFQGKVLQVPPMFSAKKIDGRKLYELARKGIEVERQPVEVTLACELLDYSYPYARIKVSCSKGTYIRSIAQDLGQRLGCFAHLSSLSRIQSGSFSLDNAIDGASLFDLAIRDAQKTHILEKIMPRTMF